MRETLPELTSDAVCRGITPAYAGNTRLCKPKISVFRDHPRVCGKHKKETDDAFVAEGSPPRMRETQKPN